MNQWQPPWKFIGVGHDTDYWADFLAALSEVDGDMAVNIEHEDADYSQVDGLAASVGALLEAADKLGSVMSIRLRSLPTNPETGTSTEGT